MTPSSSPTIIPRRDQTDPGSRAKVKALKAFCRFYGRVFHQVKVLSPCRLPRTGPAILVCNHTNGLDPVLIQSVMPRIVTWMMAREYYEIAALRWGFELIGAIPVERNGRDLSATRAALRALRNGQVVGIFPEGRLEPDCALLPFQPGAAMLARRSGAGVYPAYLDGTQRGKEMLSTFLHSQVVTLAFGPQVETAKKAAEIALNTDTYQIQQAVETLRARVSSLKAGGRPNLNNSE